MAGNYTGRVDECVRAGRGPCQGGQGRCPRDLVYVNGAKATTRPGQNFHDENDLDKIISCPTASRLSKAPPIPAGVTPLQAKCTGLWTTGSGSAWVSQNAS
jgi:hypothetical protein